MKLNLLPQTEKKSRQGKTAVVVATLIILFSIAGYGVLTFFPRQELANAKDAIGTLPQDVANINATALSADTIIGKAGDVIRNAQLAQAMIDHNDVYPKLYDDVKRYIPPYYRIQSMTASPISATQSQLTLVGTLTGYQRYADLILALMRFKDASTIVRQGYNLNDAIVPSLEDADQKGKMRLATESPVPDDDLERLTYFQAKAASAPRGYQAVGGYGDGTSEVRGALPDASVVTIVMVVNRNLQVPLASETLHAGGAAGAGAAVPGFGGPGAPGAAGPAGPPTGAKSAD